MLYYKMDNLKRIFNTRRQEKLRFQASNDDGEKASMSLVSEHKEIIMLFIKKNKN